MPFVPVFGGGTSRFQPVSVNDLGRMVELLSRKQVNVEELAIGKIIEAGGPEGTFFKPRPSFSIGFIRLSTVFTYRQLMEFILEVTGLKRPIVSVPFVVGTLQATILERLPVNLFTITRGQVCCDSTFGFLIPVYDVQHSQTAFRWSNSSRITS